MSNLSLSQSGYQKFVNINFLHIGYISCFKGLHVCQTQYLTPPLYANQHSTTETTFEMSSAHVLWIFFMSYTTEPINQQNKYAVNQEVITAYTVKVLLFVGYQFFVFVGRPNHEIWFPTKRWIPLMCILKNLKTTTSEIHKLVFLPLSMVSMN